MFFFIRIELDKTRKSSPETTGRLQKPIARKSPQTNQTHEEDAAEEEHREVDEAAEEENCEEEPAEEDNHEEEAAEEENREEEEAAEAKNRKEKAADEESLRLGTRGRNTRPIAKTRSKRDRKSHFQVVRHAELFDQLITIQILATL